MGIEIWIALVGVLVPTISTGVVAYIRTANKISALEAGLENIRDSVNILDKDSQENKEVLTERISNISDRLTNIEEVKETLVTLSAEVKYHHEAVDKFITLAFTELDKQEHKIDEITARLNRIRPYRPRKNKSKNA